VGEEIVGGDDSQAALVAPSFRHRGSLIESFGFLGSINDHIGAEYRILVVTTWENSVVRVTWSSMHSAVKALTHLRAVRAVPWNARRQCGAPNQ
jgi:hypothetical protein